MQILFNRRMICYVHGTRHIHDYVSSNMNALPFCSFFQVCSIWFHHYSLSTSSSSCFYSALLRSQIYRWLKGRHYENVCENACGSPSAQLTETKEGRGRRRGYLYWLTSGLSFTNYYIVVLLYISILFLLYRYWIKALIFMIQFEVECMKLIKLYE
jgi:hypothetical protein